MHVPTLTLTCRSWVANDKQEGQIQHQTTRRPLWPEVTFSARDGNAVHRT